MISRISPRMITARTAGAADDLLQLHRYASYGALLIGGSLIVFGVSAMFGWSLIAAGIGLQTAMSGYPTAGALITFGAPVGIIYAFSRKDVAAWHYNTFGV